MRPVSPTVPMTHTGQRSRAQIDRSTASPAESTSSASFSWYSEPQMSSTLMVASPRVIARMSISPPQGEMISFTTLQLPPAPWSWMDRMGLAGPSSTQARTTRLSLCAIWGSPRCTALKSSSASFAPLVMLLAAPPPRPMR